MTTPHTPPSPLEIADWLSDQQIIWQAHPDKLAYAGMIIRDQHARLAACEELLGTDTPWPMVTLLQALAIAESELAKRGADFDGWEAIQQAAIIAKQRISALNPNTVTQKVKTTKHNAMTWHDF